MDKTANAAVAEADSTSAVKTNMSATEFALRRAARAEEKASVQTDLLEPEQVVEEEVVNNDPPPSGEPEPQVEGQQPEAEGEEKPQGDQVASDDVLSKLGIDLGSLSKEDYDAVVKSFGGRAGERIRELTWRAKTAEEQLAKVKSAEMADPLATELAPAENPYSDLKSVDELREKAREVDALIEWAEDVLDDSAQYGPDEEVVTLDGKALTKKEVRDNLKQARKARNDFLPARLEGIQREQQANQQKAMVAQRAVKDFPWITDKKSELAARYAGVVGSPEMKIAYESSPALSVHLPYLIAAGIDRIYGKDTGKPVKEPVAPVTPRVPATPPSMPSDGAAISSRTTDNATKALNELNERFKKSGRKEDFIKKRILRHGGQ